MSSQLYATTEVPTQDDSTQVEVSGEVPTQVDSTQVEVSGEVPTQVDSTQVEVSGEVATHVDSTQVDATNQAPNQTDPTPLTYVPCQKFYDIVSILPGFEFDPVTFIYRYSGSRIQFVFETIQSILLWYSNGKKSNVFNCKIQRRQCPAYIRFLNKIRPELEWHYNHSHDCVTNDYFNKLEESLNIQKYILRHYKSLQWDNIKEDYCSRLEKSKVKYFDSCNTLINLIYKSVYYRLNQDSHLEILRQFQNSQSAFLETKYKVFSKETSYGHQNWCIVLFNSRAEDGDVLHVASTDGLAIDIVPQLKQKDYDGTITLTSVISRSSVTGLESPNVLMVTNLRSDEALDYFFDTSKDYLSKARGFVIDCDFHLFDSIKKYYPSHEVRLCPLSINEILCKTWLVNGSVRLISDIEFLSRFFRSLSIMDKDQFEDEWRSIKSLFLPSRKWHKTLDAWYGMKHHWQLSYINLPLESNAVVKHFHSVLRKNYIGQFEWKYFENLLEALSEYLDYINGIESKVVSDIEPRFFSTVEYYIWKQLTLLFESSEERLSQDDHSQSHSIILHGDDPSIIVKKTGKYQYQCPCKREYPFHSWCEHILRKIIESEHENSETYNLVAGTHMLYFHNQYVHQLMDVKDLPDSLAKFPIRNVTADEVSNEFAPLKPLDYEDHNLLGVGSVLDIDDLADELATVRTTLKRKIRENTYPLEKRVNLMSLLSDLNKLVYEDM